MMGVFFIKKAILLLLSMIICISFSGCSSADSNITQIPKSTYSASNETTIVEIDSTTVSNQTTQTNTTAQTTTDIKKHTTATTASATVTTSKKIENTSEKTTQKTNEKKSTTKSAVSKTTTKKQTTTSSTITCTVTVECKSILNHMDNLKAGHESYVPSDGYIINESTVTLDNGSSAYDAVKAACNNNNVSLNTVSSSYGKYIAGFNNIDEKDCGNQSGWLYFVNGSSPSKSCSKYILSNGDNVVFSYTCS